MALKSARAWAEEVWGATSHAEKMEKWIQAIQADARAGMVPEGECTHVGKRTELWDRLHEKLNAATVEHEAELAKAWCAGRDAAAIECDRRLHEVLPHLEPCEQSQEAARIRALQPPGGKANTCDEECDLAYKSGCDCRHSNVPWSDSRR